MGLKNTTTAHLQPLTFKWWRALTGWMIVIVRVYEPGGSYSAKSPYKFMTVAVLNRRKVYIYGMQASQIEWTDLRSIDRELYKIGVRVAHWTHNGAGRRYKLKG